jgi:hypothetical protein
MALLGVAEECFRGSDIPPLAQGSHNNYRRHLITLKSPQRLCNRGDARTEAVGIDASQNGAIEENLR